MLTERDGGRVSVSSLHLMVLNNTCGFALIFTACCRGKETVLIVDCKTLLALALNDTVTGQKCRPSCVFH